MKFVEKSVALSKPGGERGERLDACARVCVYTRCDAMCDEAAAMCKNCECDVDGSDGEPMPHIRYAHSEPRGCDVASGLHAPGSYPPGPDHLQSLTYVSLTTDAPLFQPISPFFLLPFNKNFPSITTSVPSKTIEILHLWILYQERG